MKKKMKIKLKKICIVFFGKTFWHYLQYLRGKLKHFLYIHFGNKQKEKDSDVIVLSFPKSGRTWLKFMIGKYFNLEYGLPFTTEFYNKHNDIPTISMFHYAEIIKIFRKKKIVFLVRDPRDTILSYYHHSVNRSKVFSGTFSEFIRNRKIGMNKIIQFYNNVYKNYLLAENVCVIRYEEMHQSPETVLKKFLEFAECQINDYNIEKAVEFSKFNKMKKKENNRSPSLSLIRTPDNRNSNASKVRKGKVGSYREECSLEDINYMNSNIDIYLNENVKNILSPKMFSEEKK